MTTQRNVQFLEKTVGELCKCLYEVTNNVLRNVLAPIGSERFFPPPILPTHRRSPSDDAMDTDPLPSFPRESGITWEEIIGDSRRFTPPPLPPAKVLAGEMDSAADLTEHHENRILQEDKPEFSSQGVHLASNTLNKGNIPC